jgi:hypothetical protein
MKKVFIYIVLIAIISCGSIEEKKIVLESTNSTEESVNDGVLENIYYSIPSPIETTILIRQGGLKFSGDLLFPENKLMTFSDKTSAALVLGILSTDLNYAMVYEKQKETSQLLEEVIKLAKRINLSAVINDKTKERIDDNINNRDSMQIIISDQFWEIDNLLKENEDHDLAALLITGGWIEGVHIACGLSVTDTSNKSIKDIISDQKVVLENLIQLNKSFEFNNRINDYIISPLIELKTIFDSIPYPIENLDSTSIKLIDNEYELGNYLTFNLSESDLNLIRNKISSIRQNILIQIL